MCCTRVYNHFNEPPTTTTMRHLFLILLVLLSCSACVQGKKCCSKQKAVASSGCDGCSAGQPKDFSRIIELDLNDKCCSPNLDCVEKMNRGEFYRVRVTGVNLGLYKVGINGRDTSAGKGYELPSFGSFALDAIKGITANVGLTSTLASTQDVALDFVKNNKSRLENSPLLRDTLQEGTTTLLELFSQPGQKSFSFEHGSVSFMHTIESPAISVAPKLRATFDVGRVAETIAFYADSTVLRRNSLQDLKRRSDELKLRVSKYVLRSRIADKSIDLYKQLEDTSFNMAHVTSEIHAIREAMKSEAGLIKRQYAEYVAYGKTHRKTIDAQEELKAADKTVNEHFAGLTKTAEEAEASMSAEKMGELLQSVVNAGNTDRWSYTSMPIQYMGGDATVQINVDAHDPKTGLPGYSTELRFPVQKPAYGGLTTSFYVGGLYDEAYSVKKTTTAPTPPDTVATTTYSLVEENPGKLEFGAAAFLTLGGKCKDERWGYQFVVGPGISIADKVKPRLLMGGGFSYGKKHMLLVNGGGIAGYVQRQANVYKSATTFSEKPENVTVAQLKANWFVSLGYMFKF